MKEKAKQTKRNSEGGYALVTLLFFVAISITIIAAVVFAIFANNITAVTSQQSVITYYTAESGVEDSLIKILRSQASASPKVLTIGSGQVSTTVTNGVIDATGTLNNIVRKVQAVAITAADGTVSISFWKGIN